MLFQKYRGHADKDSQNKNGYLHPLYMAQAFALSDGNHGPD